MLVGLPSRFLRVDFLQRLQRCRIDAPSLTAVARPVMNKKSVFQSLTSSDINVTWEVIEVEVTNNSARAPITLATYPTRVKNDWHDKRRFAEGSGDGGPEQKVSAPPNAFTSCQSRKTSPPFSDLRSGSR